MSKVSAFFVANGSGSPIERTLESLDQQRESLEVELLVIRENGEARLDERLQAKLENWPHQIIAQAGANRAQLWNLACEASTGEAIILLEGGQVLAPKALAVLLEGLNEDESLGGAFGRAAIIDAAGNVQQHPDGGRTGRIFNRLIEKKHYVACTAAVLFRRRCLDGGFNDIYQTPRVAFFEQLLNVSHFHPFRYVDEVVVTAPAQGDDGPVLEEMVKFLATVLHGGLELGERGEQKIRKRLARALVALGKFHYRREQYARAGRFIDQAVKIAPTYFKGRRYQFLNFVGELMSRS